MENIIRFSVSLPKQLLDELDSKISAQGYASRSEFTRDLTFRLVVQEDTMLTKSKKYTSLSVMHCFILAFFIVI